MSTLQVSAGGGFLSYQVYTSLPPEVQTKVGKLASDDGYSGFNFLIVVKNADGSAVTGLNAANFKFVLLTGWLQPAAGDAQVEYVKAVGTGGWAGFYRVIVSAQEPGAGPLWWFTVNVHHGSDTGVEVMQPIS